MRLNYVFSAGHAHFPQESTVMPLNDKRAFLSGENKSSGGVNQHETIGKLTPLVTMTGKMDEKEGMT